MKTMPNSTQEEKLRWIKPILEEKISIKNMVLVCPFSERAIKYWLSCFRKYGSDGLKNKPTLSKSQPNETTIRIKERIIELRRETDLGALKIHWKLKKEGIIIHPRTIGKILKKEKLIRKYRFRKQTYKKPEISLKPGELMEIDVKYVPERIEGKRFYQFTAIDCSSRWRYLKIYSDYTNHSSISFLKELIAVSPFEIKAVKTDNGMCFTNRYTGYLKSSDPFNPKLHGFDVLCNKLEIKHYLIDPGKPAQNGKVERSHRSDQEYFYEKIKPNNVEELRYQIKLWNVYYNNLEHCSLNGLTPNQVLERLRKVQNVRT